MISGKWIKTGVAGTALLILLYLADVSAADVTPATATPERIETIIRGIDTPRDTPLPFVERRTNQLLTEPLTLTGDLLFTTEGTLSKRIGEPFNEQITISAQRVELRRQDKVRRLALDRRPDIKAFYVGMQALLAGDVSALHESFDVVVTESAGNWSLDLAPKEKKLRKFVARLVISGAAAQVRTVRTEQPNGDWQEMSFHVATD